MDYKGGSHSGPQQICSLVVDKVRHHHGTDIGTTRGGKLLCRRRWQPRGWQLIPGFGFQIGRYLLILPRQHLQVPP